MWQKKEQGGSSSTLSSDINEKETPKMGKEPEHVALEGDDGSWTEALKGIRDKGHGGYMIVSWNIRGLNKVAKQKEISSRLFKLQPNIAILLETRVKKEKAEKWRQKIGGNWQVCDNYRNHANGRIWILWQGSKVNIQTVSMTDQMIHCGLYGRDGKFVQWLTAMYAANQLERRKELWKDIERLGSNQQGPWIMLGDFNNVLGFHERIGRNEVKEAEFSDLREMMVATGLFEVDCIDDKFTWYNKHAEGAIYSCIDRVIGNLAWIQSNKDKTVHILEPGISDHAMLCIKGNEQVVRKKTSFKFINAVIEAEGYRTEVEKNWKRKIHGNNSQMMWNKLKRL
ncbi:uncharacterized protein LOC131623214 [Vicia villosa]|uniref:uncharacterized protein LOC131623214 n=1 Tax=Vicia villosa TaxID=3911 RepID=UPI00273BCA55|nr:uncharacterized protein LOC131623214 [Vicia villosa]